jgi:sulfite reductase (NADPH) flavoprotein alpha-component
MSPNPAGVSPLSPEHLARLQAFARELSPLQRAWASGWLAAGLDPASLTAAPAAATLQATVLHGSETGHARSVANRIGEQLNAAGVPARVIGMGDYRPRELKDERFLLVVTATHGEGDPPEPARGFHEFLMGRKAPKLAGLQFAVLGLGDSSYEFFCKTARDIDARLESLGGERIRERRDCDVDFEAPAAEWSAAAVPLFVERLKAAGATAGSSGVPGAGLAGPADALFTDGRSAPLPAVVLDHLRLNGRGSDKSTWHIEFDIKDAPVRHLPGDALGVIVQNDPALVAELLEPLGLGSDTALVEELVRSHELTTLTPAFIEAYARAGEIALLTQICADRDRSALRKLMANRQIVDLIREYPLKGLSGTALKGMLRKLEPRLYSIASSAEAAPGEIHITVAEVQFRSAFGTRLGVASGQLCRRIEPGAELQVYVQRNEQFRLPEDPATPIIMIGAGTGVAPYRAFMQQREMHGAAGRAWLFFGERRFRTDFLYQTEWQRYLKDGLLTRMEVAFSRDQAEKVYVQQRLRECGRELYAWLEQGACIYVCGDAENMAPDVHAALIDIIATHGGRDAESAREYLNDLTLERRYRRDVY